MKEEHENKQHWETVYAHKSPQEVSWTQTVPQLSLDFIQQSGLPKSAKIIDIGGGDSLLVDFLLADGFENITVLDISEKALEKAKNRLGNLAQKVTWIVSDIRDFKPTIAYEFWHDRATFHFLTQEKEVALYQDLLQKAASKYVCIGTFSETGPLKCSGLFIQQYSAESLVKTFSPHFKALKTCFQDHVTPFNTSQNFVFAYLKKDPSNQ